MEGVRPVLVLLASLLLSAGCFSPATTRLPNFVAGNERIERQAAQTKDPYPVKEQGPDTGFRPLEYQQARSEARLSKDKFYTWARPELRAAPGYGPTSWNVPPWMVASPTGPGPAQAWASGPPPVISGGLPPQGYPIAPVYAPTPDAPAWGAPPIATSPYYPLY